MGKSLFLKLAVSKEERKIVITPYGKNQ